MNTNNHNSTVPVVWTSQTAEVKQPAKRNVTRVDPWYQVDSGVDEESVSDVIDALRGTMGVGREEVIEDDEDEDRLALM